METLARAYAPLQGLGVEVLAVPLDPGEAPIARLGANPPVYYPVVTEGAEEIARAYGLFRRNLSPEGMKPDPPMPAHMELLIDRAGYLRARWISGEQRDRALPSRFFGTVYEILERKAGSERLSSSRGR